MATPFNFSKNEDDAKLSYEVAHRLILKLAEYVTEKAANPVKVSRNIMINHETHLNGSKHLKKMKQLGQEDVSTNFVLEDEMQHI